MAEVSEWNFSNRFFSIIRDIPAASSINALQTMNEGKVILQKAGVIPWPAIAIEYGGVIGDRSPLPALHQQRLETAPIIMAYLHESLVFNRHLVTSSGDVVLESVSPALYKPGISQRDVTACSAVDEIVNQNLAEEIKGAIFKKHKIPGEAALILNRQAANYAHWHLQILPAALIARRELGSHIRLIVPVLAEWQRKSLRQAFGSDIDKNIIEITANNLWQFQTIYYPSPTWQQNGGRFNALPAECYEMFDKLGNHNRLVGWDGPKKIYLSRFEAKNRPLANERELTETMESLGFSVVQPERLDYEQQIRLFANAEVIAGPAGAAFANLVFCKSNALVIEFSSKCFSPLIDLWGRLLAVRGLRHAIYVDSDNIGNVADHPNMVKSWSINIEHVKKFMKQVLADA